MNIWVLLQGFGLGASMIIPIGAQNAFVINQGIKRQHHLSVAAICSVCDILFISAGVFGGGALLAANPTLLSVITLGGIAFLTLYGFASLRRAWHTQSNHIETDSRKMTFRMVISAAFAVTVLNPHVYLDTVVVLGSIGGKYAYDDRIAFALGTMLASLTWFFGISILAARMANVLSRPRVQQGIDIVIGFVMLAIAFQLAKTLVHIDGV
ncbi:LysE/ArgO family amino acid transporter [Thaumasiovibrio subtropicus]|uniref:LysE/ArgO family amino acid transporter n=1 Tax=Thaumasiovibrio subtropicus TaxID=1891207 RepID=UPI000B351DBD|nr:LysE/ArgO family amino acid transporter [Thaumasiovibrio subtropicus]